MPTADRPDPAMVVAARNGDRTALNALVAESMPLVYNIVGRALAGHADVDDVVQEIMLRAVHGLPSLRDPASFRSWLVAIAVRQLHNHHRARRAGWPGDIDPDEVADPGADFVELTVVRLGLSGQRREVVEATRWLDPDDRQLLSLWWLEASGQLTRAEVAQASQLTTPHAAVQVQRMKAQLDTARAIVRALNTAPRCQDLAGLIANWDGRPSPLWRKRLARHRLNCPRCGQASADQIPLHRLLATLMPVPPPDSLVHALSDSQGLTGLGTGGVAKPAAAVARQSARGLRRLAQAHGLVPAVAAVAAAAVIIAGTAVALGWPHRDTPALAQPNATPTASTAPPTASPTPQPLATVAARPSSPRPVVPAVKRSVKKGVGAWYFTGFTQALADVRASWYYNWSSARGNLTAPPGVEFVPMIWGAASVKKSTLDQAKSQGKALLGFNEPDLTEQANMTVAQALELWPQLESTGMRLGSPSPAFGANTPGSWFDQFMAGAAQRGYRIDFIVLHWYGADFSAAATNQLKSYLQATYNRYHKPIWLTEYALINFGGSPKYPTQDQQAAFAKASVAMMEGLSYVERYAWFGLPATDGAGTGLYRDGTTPTTVGAAYRAAG